MFKAGQFVQELLVTDTVVYHVVSTTPKTITLQHCVDGQTIRRESNGSPYPIVHTEQVPYPQSDTKTLRLRKDGTYRTSRSSKPLRPASTIDGIPVRRVDYSF